MGVLVCTYKTGIIQQYYLFYLFEVNGSSEGETESKWFKYFN